MHRAFVVVGDGVLDEASDGDLVAGRVEPGAPDELAHLALERADGVHVPPPHQPGPQALVGVWCLDNRRIRRRASRASATCG